MAGILRISMALASCFLITTALVHASDKTDASSKAEKIEWLDDYSEAMAEARLKNKLLCIYFQPRLNAGQTDPFERSVFSRPDVIAKFQDCVAVRLPLDATILSQGKDVRLINHPTFAELHGSPGLALLDYRNPDSKHYNRVVSVLPFQSGRYYRFQPRHVAVLFDLPEGTLTQRTMVFAVRIHPEAPRSVNGEASKVLLDAAEEHCRHQATIRVQGHHNWGGRFPRLSRLLGRGLRAQEVVAESWPNQRLLDAACDCVDSWRQSSGHWSAVCSEQNCYGYDMQRGSNGIWYATGLFGNRR